LLTALQSPNPLAGFEGLIRGRERKGKRERKEKRKKGSDEKDGKTLSG